MLVFLCIAILLLHLIAVQIRVGVNFYLDVFGNSGFIKAYVFGIRVYAAEVHFEHDADKRNNLVIGKGAKEGKIHLTNDPQDKQSVGAMMKNTAFSRISIQKISAHFTAGRANDSFFTVALMQTLRVFFYGLLAPLKCKFGTRITESFTPLYDRDVFQVDFIGIIEVSIANIIIGVLGGGNRRTAPRKQEVRA